VSEIVDRCAFHAGRTPDSNAGFGGVSAFVDPSGKFLNVANNVNETLSACAIDPTLGVLTPVPGSPYAAGSSPTGVTVTIKPQ